MEHLQNLDLDKLYQLAANWLVLNSPRLISAIVILVVGLWFIRLLKKWLSKSLFKRNIHGSVKPFLQSLIINLLYIVLFFLVMQILGVQLTIFAAAITSLGVTIGLALSGTLQNFVCGILILLLKPFKVSDHILAQGQEGTVESIQIFYTIVKTNEQKTVIIPNSKLSNEVIVKFPDSPA